jgi:hypothetical protein
MVFGRSGLLLVPKQFLKHRFLLCAAAQDQKHAGHRQIRCGQALIEIRSRKRVRITSQRAPSIFIDSSHNAA